MQQIANWLQNLGLGQYAQRFAENEINFAILADLTEQDLQEIGVTSLGHRRQLLRAITELKGGETGTPKPATEYIAPVTPHDTAERRQVTVMFADLVGSTALSARMDPEDLREVIAAYRKCTAETVRHLGGFVSQYLGDGVVVFFGYPQAHEDDAERAVRAGLQLVAAVAGLRTRASLQTRVGIATGLVVVGELTDAGGPQERGIIGQTPNLAARLQSSAEPNQVIIAESTRRLLGNLFELKHLGARGLKGIAEPVQTWAVLRVSSVASRFEALHTAGLMALIGREEEVELLLRRWSTAKTGEGQVVLLSGEAGIGKSRLTAELLERLAGEPLTRSALFLLPPTYRQRALPDHRPDGTCCRDRLQRHPANEARQARRLADTDRDFDRGCRAPRRYAVASQRWTIPRAQSIRNAAPGQNAGSAHTANRGVGKTKPGVDDI